MPIAPPATKVAPRILRLLIGHAHVDAKAARRLARTALSGLAPDEVIEESVVLRLGRGVGDTGG